MQNIPEFPQKELKPVPPLKQGAGFHMNQKFMLPEDKIRQVYRDGNVVGIECCLLVPAYHSYRLSMIDHIIARYDGVEFRNDPMTFSVNGHTYTFEEMKTMPNVFWEFGEYATLFIPIPGGVGLGVHKLEVGIASNGNGIRKARVTNFATAIINFIEN